MPDKFTHLHVHSHYSLLDGLDSPETLVKAAKDAGQTAIALTDHGVLGGHRALQKACADEGIKPILGVEAYISATDRFDKRSRTEREIANDQVYNHIILLAKNQTGVESINKMSKIAWEEGFYHKPRIDRELLYEYSDGVIVLSGCFNGIPSKAIEASREDPDVLQVGAQFLMELKEAFGDDAYVELQPHNDQDINEQLYQWSKQFGIKPVVTGDCHYAYEEDRALEDAFLVISSKPNQAPGEDYSTTEKLDLLDRLNVLYPDRFMSFKDIDVFVSNRTRLQEGMERHGLTDPAMYDNTQEIAAKVEPYEYYEGLELLPSEFEDPVAELERRALEGLAERNLSGPEYMDRLREELRVIRKKNFAPYFIIVDDLVKWARSKDILVGPGRGSAAGSLLCYSLGITTVDPIKYNLLFARFINEERNDFPDIDLDFEDTRRGEVKEYLRDKYGHVASIATYVYFKDKMAIKDAARVLGVPYADVEAAMKEVPADGGMEHYLDWVPKMEEVDGTKRYKDKLSEFKDKYPDVAPLAEKLVGRIRGAGMHAGGIVVANEPIEKLAPIETKKDNASGGDRIPVAAYDMNEVEDIGLIKFDALGLSELSVIHNTLRFIKEQRGIDINLEDIDLDDEGVHRELTKGNTVGVFQAKAAPYTRLLTEMGCNNFDELVASNALVRPGAMDTVGPTYLRRKNGEEEITYVHDIMEPFLRDTYGVIIYQEQVMQAAVNLGGMSWSQADKLRKIIGKKRDVSEFEQYKDDFIKGATNYISLKEAEELWHDFEAHAGYSFNKSHAVAYSVLTVWTMWLKINYPTEFIAASLINEGVKSKVTQYFIEAKRLGVKMLLPHINKSDADYTIEDGKIRLGLSSIKYISDKVARPIIKNRPYGSYEQFLEVANAKYSGINSRAIDALNKIGGAAFKDNPRTGDEEEHLYEYLGIPKFDTVDLPAIAEEVVTPISEFTEGNNKVCIIGARVSKVEKKKSKRTGRSYIQIHLMDDTGTMSIFHGGGDLPNEGEFYYFLIAGSNIADMVTAKEVRKAVKQGIIESPLVKYMLTKPKRLIDGRGVYVVKLKSRKTKKQEMMGNLIIADSDRNLHDLLVFPGVYRKAKKSIREGQRLICQAKKLDDGGMMLAAVYDED